MLSLRSLSRRGAALVAALLLSGAAAAQSTNSAYFPTQKGVTVSTTHFPEARAAVRAFVQRRARQLVKQLETPDHVLVEFALAARDLPALDSLATGLGYVTENNLTTQNLRERVQALQDEQDDRQQQLARFRQQLGKRQGDTAALRSGVENTAQQLRRAQRELAAYAEHQPDAYVTLQVFDEITFPNGNRRVSFVNMPGVEVGLLRLENPRAGYTNQFYRGYSVKYLVTRGKSFFNLGVYKPTSGAPTDSAAVSELFVINFGQDFYPRHFGRGSRTFLNVYTTYQIGGFILNHPDDSRDAFIPNANLGLGLELIKTRHVLLDTKASYFVPLHHLNRDLRGVLFQGSFNFVF